MDFIQAQWPWIASNPWGAIGLISVAFCAGWALAKLYYSERLEILKEKAKAADPKPGSGSFAFSQSGRSGKNILSSSTHAVCASEGVSMRAEVPRGSRIHVELSGPAAEYLDAEAAWVFSLNHKVNWTAGDYEERQEGVRQSFDAEEGIADMQMRFSRVGDVVIAVYEGESNSPSWTKKIAVVSSI